MDDELRQFFREEFLRRHARRSVGPCRVCGGVRFHGRPGQELTSEAPISKMDVYVCRGCGHAELFARNPADFSDGYEVEVTPPTPYR